MGVFEDYARHYDTFYREKDYAAETAFVLDLAARRGVRPLSVLDMGCGTARHVEEFIKAGLRVDGFDRSPTMLEQGRRRTTGYACDLWEGDLTTFSNGRTYDLVVSMFAVMGYLTDNDAMMAGLRTARRHLHPGGLFVFDGWFGPAVLAEKPVPRRHEYKDDQGRQVVRAAEPVLDVVAECVTVNYRVTVDGAGEPVEESHRMRFFFVQETRMALAQAGFRLEAACPFMEPDATLTDRTWNVSFVARAE